MILSNDGIKSAKVYNEYFRVKYENSKWDNLGRLIEHELHGSEIKLTCKNGLLSIFVMTGFIVRIKTSLKDKVTIPSFAVCDIDTDDAKFDFMENEYFLKIKTDSIIIEIIKDPVRIIFKNYEGKIINSDSERGILFNREFIKCEKELPNKEVYFGLGERAGALQKRGTKSFMWNTDYPRFETGSDPLYKSIPFFIGLNNGMAYGIFLDSPSWSAFDMGKSSNDKYSFGCYSTNLDYYFIYGPEIKDVVKQYTNLTGKIELPPVWSIGYQQCRWSYYPEEKVKEIANTFRAKKIPCDVIYLDIDYMDDYKIFTYDKNKFSDLKKLTEYLLERGFRLVCIIDPGVKAQEGFDVYDEGVKNGYFIKKSSGKQYLAEVWPGASVFPDFLNSEVRSWWASLQKRLLDEGVSGIWNDMNEPATFDTPGRTVSLDAVHNFGGQQIDHVSVHNVYSLLENKATYEGLKNAKPDERPFILSRSIYAGGQKYTAVWIGDNTSNEEHLKLSIPMCLNLGLSGFAFSGMDIGGFHGNPSPELYTRWLQMGVFFPLCRTHSAIETNDQEPWSFGGGYEELNRKAIELRYKLMPYIYTLFYEASQTGIPIIRPLVLEYPDDQNVFEIEDEFLLGMNMLIAPVLELGKKSRRVYLPQGVWYDYYSDEKFAGGKEYDIEADIDKIPVFVKAGAILPEQKLLQYFDEQPADKIILNVYPGDHLENYMYEDDGISYKYTNEDYRLTRFSQISKDDKLFINISKPEGKYDALRTFLINIKGIDRPFKNVKYLFEDFKITDSEDEFYRNLNIAYYDREKRAFRIKFTDKSEDVMLTLLY